MTTHSSSLAAAETRAAPIASGRNLALDRARTFIIMLVLIHHSVIPYTYHGHTDRHSFIGFDCVVWFNDSFFMAAMFLLSGLFVWPSLQRKGNGQFLRDRCWRLGLPSLVCAAILMPIAYYAVALRHDPDIGFTDFWWNMVTVGPWPSGPAWFVSVLLALDGIAALSYLAAPNLVAVATRLSLASLARPSRLFWALLIASIVVYVPAVLYLGASRWFVVGPFSVQASRILLYALYFCTGVGIGAIPLGREMLAADGGLARRWPIWLAAAIASYGSILALAYIQYAVLPDQNQQPLWWQIAYALAFVSYSAAQTFNVLALFLRFENAGSSLLDCLRDNAYGIYLVHYVAVLWLQYALSDISFGPVTQLSAVIKATLVFILTLAFSNAATAALRRIPGATRVL
jgi:peptidoglycan/LPS O-acetylase OafA/YrhL